jgi:hypothetical protein
VIAKNVQQRRIRIGVDRMRFAVDVELDHFASS